MSNFLKEQILNAFGLDDRGNITGMPLAIYSSPDGLEPRDMMMLASRAEADPLLKQVISDPKSSAADIGNAWRSYFDNRNNNFINAFIDKYGEQVVDRIANFRWDRIRVGRADVDYFADFDHKQNRVSPEKMESFSDFMRKKQYTSGEYSKSIK